VYKLEVCVLCVFVKEKEVCLCVCVCVCVFKRGSLRFCMGRRKGGEYVPRFKNVNFLETKYPAN